jgi:hypothetical protein
VVKVEILNERCEKIGSHLGSTRVKISRPRGSSFTSLAETSE